MIKRFFGKILYLIKNETVLSAAVILAAASAFFIRPDSEYIGYIDFRTIALLFCLMAVMAGFQSVGVFKLLAEKLLKRVKRTRGLVLILMALCFFSSMVITNDVALITFVPFTFTVLNMLDEAAKRRLIIPVTAMQTVAANLGSMLTPIGNPQNLYLHGISGMGFAEFITLMLPYTCASLAMLVIWALLASRDKSDEKGENTRIRFEVGTASLNVKRTGVYIAAFVLCLLTVARVIDYKITLIAVTALVAAADHRIFARVDYTLLLTFIAFFVFIGNMGRISAFSDFIGGVIDGRECVTGILASQVISNVPAALLLSGFTDNFRPLIIGVNLGGLGTLIASMASLISFKLLGREDKRLRGKYMICFTVSNVIFLAALMALYIILK